jgi:hypothetical protein
VFSSPRHRAKARSFVCVLFCGSIACHLFYPAVRIVAQREACGLSGPRSCRRLHWIRDGAESEWDERKTMDRDLSIVA